VSLNHLLREFLSSSATSAKALETLLFEHAEPLIRRIVGRRLSGSVPQQDREDTVGDALVELLGRLESWKHGDSRPIDDFLAYTSVIARHSCDHYLRSLQPQKFRMRNRIFYLLDTSPDYAEWDTEPGRAVCGWARQTGQSAGKLEPGWYHSIPIRPGASEPDIVAQIMSAVSPLRVDDLLEATAHLSGLGDETTVEWGDVEAVMPSHEPDYEERLDFRRALGQLWMEIRELPVAQRIALLLNLRDEQGNSPLASFPALGIATLRQIAEALEFPPEELAGIWSRLPLSDLEIAKRLTLERQQIINMRKAARQRLARRVGGNMTPNSASSTSRSGKIRGKSEPLQEKSSRG
jgi:DNA-directed RNA polymerase specialized sigma24 family protein